jgi:c(7)-type cytochrome triheme protein
MRRIRRWRVKLLVTAAAGLFASALAAQTMPKLPDGIALPMSEDSIGQVTFYHFTHVDESKPDCTTCHPKLFSIVKVEGKTRAPITHEVMGRGESCGACHDGKKAFAIDDDCTMCHRDPE